MYNPRTNAFQRFQHHRNDPDGLADNSVWDLFEDTNGAIWAPTFNGLDRYDAAGLRFKHYRHYPGNPTGLTDNSVQSFAGDKEGMLWIGTRGGGLNRFDPVKQTFTHYLHDPDNPNTPSSNTVLAFAQTQNGVLWIGTGTGLDRFDPQKKTFTHYQHDPKDSGTLSHGAVRGVDIAQDGSLWLGMYGGGLDRFDPVTRKFTHFMPEQDNPNSLVSEWVYVVFIDSSGKVWVGGEGGLSCLDPKTGKFTNYNTGKLDFNTRAIYQDQHGTVWIGTNGGLKRFNPESQTFTEYNTSDGLAGNMVVSIIADDQGFLWIGTNKGLSKFDPKRETFRNYDARDGLQGNQFRRNAVYKTPDGELYFGGVNGFNSFFPEKVVDNPHIPPIALTDFQLFNRSVSIGGDSPLQQHISVAKQITLSHDQSVFSIEFAALNYRDSAKNQYAYMMEGFDEDWIYVGSNRRFATYTNLDPGAYIFRVKGANNDGLWNEQGTSIAVVILPPWWETLWFYSAMGTLVLIIVSAVTFYVIKLRREITNRKKAEEDLGDSRKKYQQITEGIETVVWEYDIPTDTWAYVSPQSERLLGYAPEEWTDLSFWSEHVYEEDRQWASKYCADCTARGEYHDFEYRFLKKNGEVIWVRDVVNVEMEGDTPVKMRGFISEVTQRKKTEKKLEESEVRFRTLVGNIPGVSYRCKCNEEWSMEFISDEIETLSGYPATDFLHNAVRSYASIIHPEDRPNSDKIAQEAIDKKEKFELEYRIIASDGTILWVYEKGQGIFDEQGKVRFLDGVIIDITNRKTAEKQRFNLERQVQHAQKLESLGVLAGGIAHDFNNLLMAILGNADLAMDELAPHAPARENIQEIEKASKRAAELAKQMLAYSGKGRFVIEPINLNEFVEEMAHLLEVSISKKAVLKFNFADNLPSFDGDATQIRQIIMNLITNASEAIDDTSGVIALSTGVMHCDRDYLDSINEILLASLEEPLAEGVYTYFEVADTGCGMDAETIEKIFDPFFTTKFTGRGLGMAAVMGIIRGHGGAIRIYSEPDKGTTFKMLFPATKSPDGDEATTKRNNAEPKEWQGHGTIMIADDEETVCAVGKQMLERLGFSTLLAADGRQAVDIFESHADEIVCVLLDLTMPHMDGAEAFRELRRINPDVTVVLCSGYSEQDATERFAGKGLAGFIQKPYNMATLKDKLIEVLPNAVN
ncbi:MAG: PAS domain-containing protein [Phycisphaerales bacterium]|nr:PAS domain-containing protein [Phycisphaerales bacterium]